MTKTDRKQRFERTPFESFLIFLPVVLLLTILPNVMHFTYITDISKLDSGLFAPKTNASGTTYLIDIFSQAKAAVLVFFAAAMVLTAILFCRWIFKNSDRKTVIYLILSGVFMLMTLLSTIFSDVQQSAWFGVYDRAEGFFTILCYFVIFLYTLFAFKRTDNYKYVMCALFVVVLVNVVIGAFQFFGADLLANSDVNSIFMPYELRGQSFDIDLLNESGKLYGTMYHYNFMGSFCAIVLPIFTTHAFFEKRVISRAFFIAFDLAALFLLIGSTSRGGLIGVIVAAVVGIIVFGKVILKKIKIVSIAFGGVAVIFVASGFLTNWAVFNRIPAMLSDISVLLSDTSDINYLDKLPIKSITRKDGGVEIASKYGTLTMSYDAETGGIFFTDVDGAELSYTDNEGTFVFDDKAYAPLSFNAQSTTGDPNCYDFVTLILKDKNYFCFKVLNDGSMSFVDYYWGIATVVTAPEVTDYFVGKEKIGSMRGYIWGRSVPLLSETLITGYGPDNFIYNFPQNDYLGKYYAYGSPITTVDKPHNLFLQIALNEGVIALLAFLAIMIFYIVDSMRLYALRKEYTKGQIMGAGVMLGVIGYLVAGVFNDSVISVAPVFWVILGLGAALNGINRLEAHPELAVSKRAQRKAEKLAAEEAAEQERINTEYSENAQQIISKMDEIEEKERPAREAERAAQEAEKKRLAEEKEKERLERARKLENVKQDDLLSRVSDGARERAEKRAEYMKNHVPSEQEKAFIEEMKKRKAAYDEKAEKYRESNSQSHQIVVSEEKTDDKK